MKTDKTLQIESLYDHHFDVLGIRITDDYDYSKSIELEEGIILDFDKNNIPVALEIIDASKVLKISEKQYLENRTYIHMNIQISEEIITVNLTVGIEIHQKSENKSINSSTINNINAPIMKTELATA